MLPVSMCIAICEALDRAADDLCADTTGRGSTPVRLSETSRHGLGLKPEADGVPAQLGAQVVTFDSRPGVQPPGCSQTAEDQPCVDYPPEPRFGTFIQYYPFPPPVVVLSLHHRPRSCAPVRLVVQP